MAGGQQPDGGLRGNSNAVCSEHAGNHFSLRSVEASGLVQRRHHVRAQSGEHEGRGNHEERDPPGPISKTVSGCLGRLHGCVPAQLRQCGGGYADTKEGNGKDRQQLGVGEKSHATATGERSQLGVDHARDLPHSGAKHHGQPGTENGLHALRLQL